jgi:hypothetical protein
VKLLPLLVKLLLPLPLMVKLLPPLPLGRLLT